MKPKKQPNPYEIYSLAAMRKRLRKPSKFDIYPNLNKRMIAATLDSLVLMLFTPLFNRIAPINRIGMDIIKLNAGTSTTPVTSITSQLIKNQAFITSWIENCLLQGAFFLLYSGIFWYFWSATPGKMLMQMKIVQARTHTRITLANIIMRLCGYIISISCLMIGILWIGTNKRHRAWHDYLAYTEVITVPFTWGKKPSLAPTQDTITHETIAD